MIAHMHLILKCDWRSVLITESPKEASAKVTGSKYNRYHPDEKRSKMRMHFGKYKGKWVHEIDWGYVRWMKGEDVLWKQSPQFVAEIMRVFPSIFRE